MLCAVNTEEQVVGLNKNINLGFNNIQTGCVATHVEDSEIIKLNKPGFYSVHFNVNCIQADKKAPPVPTEVTVQMVEGSGIVEGAICSVDASIKNSISIDMLVQVKQNCCQIANCPTTIAFKNIGAECTFSNLQVSVSKIA